MPGKRLTHDERVVIETMWKLGSTETEIASATGRHKSTINRELWRNNSHRHGHKHGELNTARSLRTGSARVRPFSPGHGRNYWRGYDAVYAGRRAATRARRPKACKLARPGAVLKAGADTYGRPFGAILAVADGQLWQLVRSKLAARWSPMQISCWLKENFPDHPELQVSHETIYQAVYLQTRGNLREELTRQVALRSARTRRRAQSQAAGALRSARPWAGDFHISTRPAEAADRAVPGHWEGDLVIGADGASAIITLVERSTRYVMLGALPGGRTSAEVIEVLTTMARRLPGHLMRTITWDNGSEMSTHPDFTVATDCRVFFADPHSPWQRGTNENTNGLLRQYFPKGVTDFRKVSPEELAATAHELNGRPRQTLGWKNPRQALNDLLVATAA